MTIYRQGLSLLRKPTVCAGSVRLRLAGLSCRSVRWEQVKAELVDAFSMPLVELDGGRVYGTGGPAFDFHEALLRAKEPGDRDADEERFEALVEDYGAYAAEEFLRERWPLRSLIGFDFDGGGPASDIWSFLLQILDVDDGRSYVCGRQFNEPERYKACAAVEGGAEVWSWLFVDICPSDETKYDMPMFGTVPYLVTNYAPSLLPRGAVLQGFSRALDEPNSTMGEWADVAGELRARGEHAPESDREALLDLYFSHCYREEEK